MTHLRYHAYAYAWGPYLMDFLQLGWYIVDHLHDDRSGHPVWLVGWPCDCPVVFPRKGEYK